MKKVIIFESFPDFSDNSRVFFEYLLNQKELNDYEFIWFVNDLQLFKQLNIERTKFIKIWNNKNKKTFLNWIKYIYYSKNALYIIHTNRSMIRINQGTKVIYLTHGCPTKNVKDSKLLNNDVDYVIVGSDSNLALYADHYNCDESKIIALGLARNDLFFKNNFNEIKTKICHNFHLNKVDIITWLPTFRKTKYNNRIDSNFNFPLGIPIIYTKRDLEQLNIFLKNNNLVIFLKPHPIQDMSLFKKYNFSNFKIINDKFLEKNNLLLNDLLKVTELLITDYSSVFNDYLLINKPILFTTDDYLEYKKIKGFMVNNYMDLVPGIKVNDFKEFYNALEQFKKGIDNYSEERLEYCKKVNKYLDGNSCYRLANFLKLGRNDD